MSVAPQGGMDSAEWSRDFIRAILVAHHPTQSVDTDTNSSNGGLFIRTVKKM